MSVYRVTGFDTDVTALVEARTPYDARRYVIEDRGITQIEDIQVEKVFTYILYEKKKPAPTPRPKKKTVTKK